jgi:hypothetical protein
MAAPLAFTEHHIHIDNDGIHIHLILGSDRLYRL